MNNEDRETYGIYKSNAGKEPGPRRMHADTLGGDEVCNQKGKVPGDIKEIMANTFNRKVCCALLSLGGFLGMAKKLFSVPWDALRLDPPNERFDLNLEKDRLEKRPEFDNDDWPGRVDASRRLSGNSDRSEDRHD